MSHEIYVFGSVTRGEIAPTSDIDVLVFPFAGERSRFPSGWSVYSPALIEEYYRKGRLFAWHLHLEAQCVYSPNATPYLDTIGPPATYSTMSQDVDDLEDLLIEALAEIRAKTKSIVYELGIAYTAIRDIAMSASWVFFDQPCFSRNAPYVLPFPCPLPVAAYHSAMLARHSSTRGIDTDIDTANTSQELLQAPLGPWIQALRDAK